MFDKLEELLDARSWKEADSYTARLLLELTGCLEQGWLEESHIKELKSDSLRTIDRLWLNASDNRFGFSKQLQIFIAGGGTLEKSMYTLLAFYNEIGWSKNNQILYYDELTFALTPNTPVGHLPGILHTGFKYGSTLPYVVDWRVDLGGGEYLESHSSKLFLQGNGKRMLLMRFQDELL